MKHCKNRHRIAPVSYGGRISNAKRIRERKVSEADSKREKKYVQTERIKTIKV